MMLDYNYEQYCAIYEALGGVTTHFVPVVGTRGWRKSKLSREDFESKLALLHEIESHDEEWLFANHSGNYIDVFEVEAWQSLDLRSDLFVIEMEKYEKMGLALDEVDNG